MTLLTFPADPLPIRSELFISGAWVDVTAYVRLADEIQIQGRGRKNEQGRPSPMTCLFTFNNHDSRFSNRNPTSPYYGKIGRNTPIRHSVTEARSFAIIDDAATSRIKTTDKASLDITGDIDIRIEVELESPTGRNVGQFLATKYRRTASANRSWFFAITKNGYLEIAWSTDGTFVAGTGFTLTSTVPLPVAYGPIALRVALDVDNGAGGKTATFYTSDSIAGTWTVLDTVTSAGTTSIFSGTAEVELGRIDDGAFTGFTGLAGNDVMNGLIGRIYGFELRNSAGTLVANAAIYNQARGTTSWSDGLTTPNTWTVEGTAEITPDNRRFVGEIPDWPQQADSTETDLYVPVVAADITQRLTVGATAVQTPLRRFFGAYATGTSYGQVTGYFPTENGSQYSTRLDNIANRGTDGSITDVSFVVPSDLPATAGAAVINSTDTKIILPTVNRPANNLGCFNWGMKFPSIPASSTTAVDIYGSGPVWYRINFSITATNFVIAVYDFFDAVLATTSSAWDASTPPDIWNMFRIQVQVVGGNVQVDLGWYTPSAGVIWGLVPTTTPGTDAGRITRIIVKGTTQNIGAQYTQFFIGQFFLPNTTAAYKSAASAFNAETTDDRFIRVCGENNIQGRVIGDTSSCEPMGPQPLGTVMDILYECMDVEQGQIYPSRIKSELLFRTRRCIQNQTGPSISYADGQGEMGPGVPESTDDDSLLRNAVTAQRADGSIGYSAQDDPTLPNSTASPTATPPGVGMYSVPINRNTYLDTRLDDMAAFDVQLGTWDEPRWKSIKFELQRSNYTGTATKLIKAHNLVRLDLGDLLTLTHIPLRLWPYDAYVMIQGIAEILANRSWRFDFNTSPYGPFFVNALQGLNTQRQRAAATPGNSTVSADFTSTATSFTVATATGRLWGTTTTKPGNFPQNVVVGGEVITISGISGTTSPQTFTVSARSVNGVVKAQTTNTEVQVQYPFRAAL